MYDLRHLRQQQTKVYFLKDVKQWMQTSNAQTPLTNIQTYKTPPRRLLFSPEDDDDFPDWELNDDTITVANKTSVRRYRTCDNLSDTKLECDDWWVQCWLITINEWSISYLSLTPLCSEQSAVPSVFFLGNRSDESFRLTLDHPQEHDGHILVEAVDPLPLQWSSDSLLSSKTTNRVNSLGI